MVSSGEVIAFAPGCLLPPSLSGILAGRVRSSHAWLDPLLSRESDSLALRWFVAFLFFLKGSFFVRLPVPLIPPCQQKSRHTITRRCVHRLCSGNTETQHAHAVLSCVFLHIEKECIRREKGGYVRRIEGSVSGIGQCEFSVRRRTLKKL